MDNYKHVRIVMNILIDLLFTHVVTIQCNSTEEVKKRHLKKQPFGEIDIKIK